MPAATRIVNGKHQTWDDDLMDWKDAEVPPQNSITIKVTDDWLAQWSEYVPKMAGEFVCGKCESEVIRETRACTLVLEDIDPELGDETQMVKLENRLVHDITYICKKNCGWTAKQEWWESVKKGEQLCLFDIETPEIEAPKANGGSINVSWPTPEFDISKLFRSDPSERDFPRSYTWGELRSTPRTSGNTD